MPKKIIPHSLRFGRAPRPWLVLLLTLLVFQASGVLGDDGVAQGKKVFEMRGCTGCHTIGDGNRAGPDLKGVTRRRSAEWLKSWLKDPSAKFTAGDKIADRLADRFLGVHMPNLGLKDDEITALLSYLGSTDDTSPSGKK